MAWVIKGKAVVHLSSTRRTDAALAAAQMMVPRRSGLVARELTELLPRPRPRPRPRRHAIATAMLS